MSPLAAIALTLLAAARVPQRGRGESALLAPSKPPESGPGEVTYVTSDQVFIDRGVADGVALGAKVTVSRGSKLLGHCIVTSATEHAATCTATELRVGDRIAVQRQPKAAAQPIAPVPDARELAARLEKVQSSDVGLVDFEGGPGGGSGAATWLSVLLSQTTFANFVSGGGPYQLQRVDVRLNDFKLWRGLRASADLSVLSWSRRPPGFASPYAASVQVFVRQLELAWRDGGRFDAALGRVWLRHVPGMTLIDGAQATVRSASGETEAGAFGGLLPNALTLAPTLTQWTAGAFVSARFSRGEGADAAWLQPELRLNWALRDGLGGRFELGLAVHAWLRRAIDAHVQVQLAALGVSAPGLIDFARVDVALRPTDSVRIALAARYRGNVAGEVLEVGAPSPGARGAHGDASVFIDASSFSLGVSGSFATDLESSLWQARVGPTLTLPHVIGRSLGLSVGYAEELGWLPGRSAFLQLSFQPHWRFRTLLRTGWFMQSPNEAVIGVSGHELSVALAVELRITQWLWVRGSLLGRQALQASVQSATDLPAANPWRAGISGGAQLGVEL